MKNLRLIIAQIKFTALQELEYKVNNAANLFSTFTYTALFILFIDILFRNIDSIGVYGRDSMLFLTLIGQICFYYLAAFSFMSSIKLAEDINTGRLDYQLVRPIPHLLYFLFINSRPIMLLRDGLPILIVIYVINWGNISISLSNFIFGLLVVIAGVASISLIMLTLSAVAMWTGKAKNTLDLFWGMSSKTEQATASMTPRVLLFSILLIPFILPVSVGSSIMLGFYENPFIYLILSSGFCLFWYLVAKSTWKKGFNEYASASS